MTLVGIFEEIEVSVDIYDVNEFIKAEPDSDIVALDANGSQMVVKKRDVTWIGLAE